MVSMLLSLCLLLPALSPSSQAICSAPGALPAPTLYLNQMHAPEANSVQLRCLVDFQLPVTRIVFCKDGEELSTQQAIKEKMNYNYDHLLSRGSAGNFTCRYEIKDNNNWVRRSKLSPAQHLSVTGGRSSSGAVEGPTRPGGGSSSGGAKKPTRSGLNLKLLLGITIPAVLVLAVVLYLLGRKVVSLRRDHRERAWRGASCSPGDQIEYASVESRRSARPPPHREETPTYGNITLR
nr:uncharacterized protein LOC102449534 isoform X3 [Pelodiscus sinensis]|eukprot:XP_025043394.1 uncharacterized protein LOC102449534 isoform X3 [Pelodiscus sinensis]